MKFFFGILIIYSTWRARRCSQAYRKHMERRAALAGRCGQ